MINKSDALFMIRKTMKFYDLCLDDVRERHQLSKIEVIIISFLYNNPGHDTVAAVSEMRMLSKGNVSRATDSLIQRGLLERIPDQTDRRTIHLRLKPAADPIVIEISDAALRFGELAFEGFSDEDKRIFYELNHRLADNICRNLERSSSTHGE